MTVSYTHLDVYKRQVKSTAFSFAKAASFSNSIAPIGTHSANSAIPAFPGAQ